MSAPESGSGADRVRTRLSGMPGVQSVDVAGFPGEIALRLDGDEAKGFVAEAVAELVQAEAGERPEVRLEMNAPIGRVRRARFESIEVLQPQPGMVRAVTTLGWQKERFVGEAEGEASAVGELRACASATMRAVEKFAGGGVTFSLIGVKEVHVFDHDLVAVLLNASELPEHRLLGTAIIVEDRQKSAALAVLSATNRAVGGA